MTALDFIILLASLVASFCIGYSIPYYSMKGNYMRGYHAGERTGRYKGKQDVITVVQRQIETERMMGI
jgi:hypothetical protein